MRGHGQKQSFKNSTKGKGEERPQKAKRKWLAHQWALKVGTEKALSAFYSSVKPLPCVHLDSNLLAYRVRRSGGECTGPWLFIKYFRCEEVSASFPQHTTEKKTPPWLDLFCLLSTWPFTSRHSAVMCYSSLSIVNSQSVGTPYFYTRRVCRTSPMFETLQAADEPMIAYPRALSGIVWPRSPVGGEIDCNVWWLTASKRNEINMSATFPMQLV